MGRTEYPVGRRKSNQTLNPEPLGKRADVTIPFLNRSNKISTTVA